MYRVLILEDEPPAVKQINTLIRKYCRGFAVVGAAENGREGIIRAKELLPDLIITDVQMPLMDGIEFVSKIKRELPDCLVLIISGYSEFEYVRSAISYGVNDYLLKPVVPSEFVYAMEKIEALLEKQFYDNRNRLLKDMANDKPVNPEQMHHYFPYEKYFLSIIRVKGIPGRFKKTGDLEIYSEKDETVAVYGRDFNEGLFLIPYEVIGNSDVRMFNRKIIKQYKKMNSYFTFVFMDHPIPAGEISLRMRELYKILDKKVVIGKTQIVSSEGECGCSLGEDGQGEVYEILRKMEYILGKKDYTKIEKEISEIFAGWEQEEKPQIYVEYVLKQILYFTQKYSKCDLNEQLLETEAILEEILAGADKMEDVRNGFRDILLQNFRDGRIEKVDAPEFMESLKEYVNRHIGEEISLTGICNRFGVSQPYFSKIFRKYTNQSFNQYITEQRMEKAKEIMRTDKDMLIKDVALMVGYSNQFYFSRIFHAYTKMSPTEFFDRCC